MAGRKRNLQPNFEVPDWLDTSSEDDLEPRQRRPRDELPHVRFFLKYKNN